MTVDRHRLRLVHDQRHDDRLRLADLAHARLERRHGGRRRPQRLHQRDVHLAADAPVRVRGRRLRARASTRYLNGTISVQVMTHEVGHNFGLGHANARNCTVGGTRVTIAADASCTTQDYADPFSHDGQQRAAPQPRLAARRARLARARRRRSIGSPGNTYTIAPYFGTGRRQARPRPARRRHLLRPRRPHPVRRASTPSPPGRRPCRGVTIRHRHGHRQPDRLAQGDRAARHDAGDDRPQGRAAARRQDDDRPGLDDLVHDACRSARPASSSGSGRGSRPRRPGSLSGTATDAPSARLDLVAPRPTTSPSAGYRVSRDGARGRVACRRRHDLDRHAASRSARPTPTRSRPSTRRATSARRRAPP